MKILGENDKRDLFKGPNNQLVLKTGIDAVLQACESAIEAQRGEMQYATARGIPTSSTLWVGVPNQPRFRFYCREALKGVSGVDSVLRFDSDILEGVLEYEAEIKTEFGTGTLGNIINGL